MQRYYDEMTRHEVIKAEYSFLLEADNQAEFITKLKGYNNHCPYLISMLKIDRTNDQYCENYTNFHIYFEYLPTNLTSILNKCQKPFP